MTANPFFAERKTPGFGSQRGIPGLDGLRAISIGLVLGAHLTGTRNFPVTGNNPFGVFGVRVFFVISGFLITSILLRELKSNGHISLARFYFRRTLRLFPACYFMIAVVALAASLNVVTVAPGDYLSAFSYTMNFHEARAWPLGHLWTLAVEEQFYVLWPYILSRLHAARSARFLVAVVAVAPLLRLASPYAGAALNFLVWSDSLATGCLLGLVRDDLASFRLAGRIFASPWFRSRWFAVVPALALAANYLPSTKLQWLFGEPLMNFLIALIVEWVMRNPAGLTGRLLNRPSVVFAGVLSYSLYLWQQLFLNRYSVSAVCAFPLNILLAIAAAFGSYLLIERPFLRLRSRLEPAFIPRVRSDRPVA